MIDDEYHAPDALDALLEPRSEESANLLCLLGHLGFLASKTDGHVYRYDIAHGVLNGGEKAKVPWSDADAKEALAEELQPHFDRIRKQLRASPSPICLNGTGLLWLDELLATYLEGLGATSTANKMRAAIAKANEAPGSASFVAPLYFWASYSVGEVAGGIFSRSIPKGFKVLARAVWITIARPRLEREARKPAIRMSRELGRTMAQGRAYGGTRGESAILVEPPKGMTLMLPFDTVQGAIQRSTGLVRLTSVLDGAAFRTYLATLALWQDAGMRDDGSFEVNGSAAILDMIGTTKKSETKNGRVSERYHSTHTAAVKKHLAQFISFRVRSVGDLEAKGGDPLLDEIRDRRTGKTVTYAHSRLIVGHLKGDYAQIPRQALRLEAEDQAHGLGIALVTRARFLTALAKGGPVVAPIHKWLEAAGVDIVAGVRRDGRDFWRKETDRFLRIAEQGGFGKMTATGTGKETELALAPLDMFAEGYRPLIAAQAQAKKIDRAAMVADRRRKK